MSTWASPVARRLRRIVAMGTLVVVNILVAIIVAVKRLSSPTTIVESTTHANHFGATAPAQTRACIVSFAQGQVGDGTDPGGGYLLQQVQRLLVRGIESRWQLESRRTMVRRFRGVGVATRGRAPRLPIHQRRP